jgi:DNA-binding MarR family transcriptional regulator
MTSSSLGAALHALARAQRTRLGVLLAPFGLHPGQDALLMLLWGEPGLRPSELATRLGVEPPTVTRMLQRLERGGLVERRPDRHDARVVRVQPTPRSRLLEGNVRRAWAAVDTTLLDALGEEGAQRLRRLAETGTAALQAAGRRPPG